MKKEENECYVYISKSLQVDWNKELGKGSFGEVYAGKIIQRGKLMDCAVKIISQTDRRQQDNKYFKQEAEFSKKIIQLFQKIRQENHNKNVKIPLVEVFEIVWSAKQDKCCIAMEKCGNSLTSERYYLYQRRYLLVDSIIILKQIAKGLEILHAENITHRDIKPENTFVIENSSFEIKIGDYGLSTFDKDLQSTVGTVSYMAPEIAQIALNKQAQNNNNFNEIGHQNMLQIEEPNKEENEKYTNKVDIWSLGVIFHELITGNQLFIGYHIKKTMMEIIKFGSYYNKWKRAQEFKSPSKDQPLTQDLRNSLEYYLPWKLVGLERVAKLIDAMLAKNPNERISAAQIVLECETILNDPQLLKEQIRIINDYLQQDEINVDEMINQKDLFQKRLLELEQKQTSYSKQEKFTHFKQSDEPKQQEGFQMSHEGEMEIENSKQENSNEKRQPPIVSDSVQIASSEISSAHQSQIQQRNQNQLSKFGFLADIKIEEFQQLNHKMNQIFNFCLDNRNFVLKQLLDTPNITKEDFARDEELRQIHQHQFCCNHLFALDDQTEPYFQTQKTPISAAYLIIQPLQGDFFNLPTYLKYFNNFHKLLFYQQLPQYQNTPLLLNVAKLKYIFLLDQGILQPRQEILDAFQEKEFSKQPPSYFVNIELQGISLYDYIRTENVKQEPNGQWSNQILLNKLEILIQITLGLCEMHKLGIFHCNLHAKNIFHSNQNCFQINFLSKEELQIRCFLQVTYFFKFFFFMKINCFCWNELSQNFRFSSAYKSPSQIVEQHTMDFENDLWSLGIIFHYVFTIQNLFAPGITVKGTILSSKFNYFSIWNRCQRYLEQRSSGKTIDEPKLEQLSKTFNKIPNAKMAELTSDLFEARDKKIIIQNVLEKLIEIKEQIRILEDKQKQY